MWSRVVPCNYRVGPGIIGADSGRVIIGSLLLPGEPHHDDDDDDDDDDGKDEMDVSLFWNSFL